MAVDPSLCCSSATVLYRHGRVDIMLVYLAMIWPMCSQFVLYESGTHIKDEKSVVVEATVLMSSEGYLG